VISKRKIKTIFNIRKNQKVWYLPSPERVTGNICEMYNIRKVKEQIQVLDVVKMLCKREKLDKMLRNEKVLSTVEINQSTEFHTGVKVMPSINGRLEDLIYIVNTTIGERK